MRVLPHVTASPREHRRASTGNDIVHRPDIVIHLSARPHDVWRRPHDDRTRAPLRLRLGPVRRRFLMRADGEFFGRLTIAPSAAGLREHVSA